MQVKKHRKTHIFRLAYIGQCQCGTGEEIYVIILRLDGEGFTGCSRLADNLGMSVVLEGIESFEQMDRLAGILGNRSDTHCQGYLLIPPLDADAAEVFITDLALVDHNARAISIPN